MGGRSCCIVLRSLKVTTCCNELQPERVVGRTFSLLKMIIAGWGGGSRGGSPEIVAFGVYGVAGPQVGRKTYRAVILLVSCGSDRCGKHP